MVVSWMSLKHLIIVFGEAEFKYTQQKCIKQIDSIDIIIIHCNKRLVGLIVQPFIFSFLAKVRLGQVGVGSENIKNQSSSLFEVLSSHYYTQIIWKVDYTYH